MKLVINASVAVKWFVREDGHEAALSIVRRGDECFAPDLILTEVAGALDKKIKAKILGRDQAIEAIRALQSNLMMVAGAKLVEASLDLASELDHPVADCVYMACAIELGAIVVTADTIFVRKAANAGYRRLVVQLGSETNPDPALVSLSAQEMASIEKLTNEVHSVFEFVRSQVMQTNNPEIKRAFRLSDLTPAFDSPNYARPTNHLNGLSAQKRHELVALCWLGRGFDGENWHELVQHVRSLDPGNRTDTSYLISKLSYLADGIERLKSLSEAARKS